MAENPVSFTRFLEGVRGITHEEFRRTFEGALTADEDEFEKMRQHILNHYEGIDVQHSFIDEAGQVWDCIPIEQQPSLRGTAGVASRPNIPLAEGRTGVAASDTSTGDPHARPGETDRFGNEVNCPPGTIPMRRVTLEEMSRFRTLHDFFGKAPDGLWQDLQFTEASTESASRKYTFAYQSVNNVGGQSYINVWQPAINIGATQIFSLAQHWYTGGHGSSFQSVECGWQVYPHKYGNANANLFIILDSR